MTRFGCPVDLVNDQASHVIKEMVQNLISMVNNFGFVVLFVLELLALLFCMTLLFGEHAKRIFSLTIGMHEFVRCLCFPANCDCLVPDASGLF